MLHNFSRHSEQELFTLLHEGGYKSPTPLQKHVIPHILKGKNLIIEAIPGEGVNGTFLLPLLLKIKPKKDEQHNSLSALILVNSGEDADKIVWEYNRLSGFSHKNRHHTGNPPTNTSFSKNNNSKNSKIQVPHMLPHLPAITCLGRDANIKKELKLLSDKPYIIVGTTERIIDHLRRGNIELTKLSYIIIHSTTQKQTAQYESDSFKKDVLFILSKVPKKTQTIVFTPTAEQATLLQHMIRRPSILTRKEREKHTTPVQLYQPISPEPKIVSDIIFSNQLEKVLIYCTNDQEAEKLEQELIQQQLKGEKPVFPLSRNSIEEIKNSFDIGDLKWIISTDYQLSPVHFKADTVIYYKLPKIKEYIRTLKESTAIGNPEKVIIIVPKKESLITITLKENTIMNVKKNELPADEDVLKGKLQAMVKQIKEEEDPSLLNEYKKLIKKNVPFTLRSYLAAYLLKNATQSGFSKNVPKENMKTLFVSIGKNRKVFPRDLSKLFRQKLKIEPDNIGSIKVLDNYSFIDISEETAQMAIDSLDGKEYRGRSITVNFARKRTKNHEDSDQ